MCSATSQDPAGTTPPPTATPTTAKSIPAPSTTVEPTLRTVTSADPLKVWIIGDSFNELFGPALVNRATDTKVIDAAVDFRYSSGLSRPEFLDWPAYIARELPDAVVVIFGGNDAQDVTLGGERFNVAIRFVYWPCPDDE